MKYSIINSSLENPALKRITYSESLFNLKQLNKPKLSLNTTRIRFISANKYGSSNKNMFKDSIEVLDDDINLHNYGINPGDLVTISGSREPENNSGSEYFEVDRVTNKKKYWIAKSYIGGKKGNLPSWFIFK